MVAFVERYKFLPDADFPYPMWLAMAKRLPQFEARDLLESIFGNVSGAAAGPMSSAEARKNVVKLIDQLNTAARPGDPAADASGGGTPLNRSS